MASERRILYAGAGLAGVSTSIGHLARTAGIELPIASRYAFAMTTQDGLLLNIGSDVMSSTYFENTVESLQVLLSMISSASPSR